MTDVVKPPKRRPRKKKPPTNGVSPAGRGMNARAAVNDGALDFALSSQALGSLNPQSLDSWWSVAVPVHDVSLGLNAAPTLATVAGSLQQMTAAAAGMDQAGSLHASINEKGDDQAKKSKGAAKKGQVKGLGKGLRKPKAKQLQGTAETGVLKENSVKDDARHQGKVNSSPDPSFVTSDPKLMEVDGALNVVANGANAEGSGSNSYPNFRVASDNGSPVPGKASRNSETAAEQTLTEVSGRVFVTDQDREEAAVIGKHADKSADLHDDGGNSQAGETEKILAALANGDENGNPNLALLASEELPRARVSAEGEEEEEVGEEEEEAGGREGRSRSSSPDVKAVLTADGSEEDSCSWFEDDDDEEEEDEEEEEEGSVLRAKVADSSCCTSLSSDGREATARVLMEGSRMSRMEQEETVAMVNGTEQQAGDVGSLKEGMAAGDGESAGGRSEGRESVGNRSLGRESRGRRSAGGESGERRSIGRQSVGNGSVGKLSPRGGGSMGRASPGSLKRKTNSWADTSSPRINSSAMGDTESPVATAKVGVNQSAPSAAAPPAPPKWGDSAMHKATSEKDESARPAWNHSAATTPRSTRSTRSQPENEEPMGWQRSASTLTSHVAANQKRRPGPSANQKFISDLSDNIRVLTCESKVAPGAECVVFLLGTAHVSKASCEEVRRIIRLVKPEVVFVEVCSDRIAMLMPADQLQVPSFSEMLQAWRQKQTNGFAVVYSWLLAKISERMEVFPGAEFRAAYEEAVKCGAVVKLGDRPVQVTLRRTWAAMSSWHKTKLIAMMLLQALWLPSKHELDQLMEQLKDSDVLTLAVEDMGHMFPSLMKTLVEERDMFMTAMLRHVAKKSTAVVAVVGKGHLAGIANNWENDSIDVASLLKMPPPPKSYFSPTFKKWAFAGAVVGGVALITTLRYWKRSP